MRKLARVLTILIIVNLAASMVGSIYAEYRDAVDLPSSPTADGVYVHQIRVNHGLVRFGTSRDLAVLKHWHEYLTVSFIVLWMGIAVGVKYRWPGLDKIPG